MVPSGGGEEIEVLLAGGTGRGGGDPGPAQAADLLHVAFGLLECGGALCVVVDDPLGEPDGTLDLQARVLDPLGKVLQRAAVTCVLIDFPDPRLDPAVTDFPGQVDLLDQPQLLAADGAGVQAEAERGRG